MSINFSSFIEACLNATDKLNFGIFLPKAFAEPLRAILKNSFAREENLETLRFLTQRFAALKIKLSNEEIELVVQSTVKPHLCNELINTIGDHFDEGTLTTEDLQSAFVMQLCTQFNTIFSAEQTDDSLEARTHELSVTFTKKMNFGA